MKAIMELSRVFRKKPDDTIHLNVRQSSKQLLEVYVHVIHTVARMS